MREVMTCRRGQVAFHKSSLSKYSVPACRGFIGIGVTSGIRFGSPFRWSSCFVGRRILRQVQEVEQGSR